jgi:hypothetical protein
MNSKQSEVAIRDAWLGIIASLALLAVAACTTFPAVRAEADPQVDFRSYRTFGFAKVLGTDRDGYETLVTQALKSATRRQMEARGYRFEPVQPELLVNFNAHLKERVDVVRMPVAPSDYYGYRSYVAWRAYDVEMHQYTEGTLNIDVVDAARAQLVWEGIATGTVTAKVYRDRKAAIEQAVERIFAKYPVPAQP